MSPQFSLHHHHHHHHMCLQRFANFTCAHSRLAEETCPYAKHLDVSFWIPVACPYYSIQSRLLPRPCGLGGYYCSESQHGQHLDDIHLLHFKTQQAYLRLSREIGGPESNISPPCNLGMIKAELMQLDGQISQARYQCASQLPITFPLSMPPNPPVQYGVELPNFPPTLLQAHTPSQRTGLISLTPPHSAPNPPSVPKVGHQVGRTSKRLAEFRQSHPDLGRVVHQAGATSNVLPGIVLPQPKRVKNKKAAKDKSPQHKPSSAVRRSARVRNKRVNYIEDTSDVSESRTPSPEKSDVSFSPAKSDVSATPDKQQSQPKDPSSSRNAIFGPRGTSLADKIGDWKSREISQSPSKSRGGQMHAKRNKGEDPNPGMVGKRLASWAGQKRTHDVASVVEDVVPNARRARVASAGGLDPSAARNQIANLQARAPPNVQAGTPQLDDEENKNMAFTGDSNLRGDFINSAQLGDISVDQFMKYPPTAATGPEPTKRLRLPSSPMATPLLPAWEPKSRTERADSVLCINDPANFAAFTAPVPATQSLAYDSPSLDEDQARQTAKHLPMNPLSGEMGGTADDLHPDLDFSPSEIGWCLP